MNFAVAGALFVNHPAQWSSVDPLQSNPGRIAMLFCITSNYSAKALNAMRENPKTNRREAVEQLLTAAGGKLVAMYGTIAEGPGSLVIFEADPVAAAAMAGVAASSDGLHNVKLQRLMSRDDVLAVRQKRKEIHSAYKQPGA
jgi:uncharacterized protein with GYD domain